MAQYANPAGFTNTGEWFEVTFKNGKTETLFFPMDNSLEKLAARLEKVKFITVGYPVDADAFRNEETDMMAERLIATDTIASIEE